MNWRGVFGNWKSSYLEDNRDRIHRANATSTTAATNTREIGREAPIKGMMGEETPIKGMMDEETPTTGMMDEETPITDMMDEETTTHRKGDIRAIQAIHPTEVTTGMTSTMAVVHTTHMMALATTRNTPIGLVPTSLKAGIHKMTIRKIT